MKQPLRYVLSFALALTLTTAQVSYGDSKNADSNAPKIVKHDSPQAVFKAVQKVGKSKDYKGLCYHMTEESQEAMGSMLILASSMMKRFAGLGGEEAKKRAEEKFAAFDKIMKRHGLNEAALKAQPRPGASPEEAMKMLSKYVKDKPAFISEMMKTMDTVNTGPGGNANFDGTLENLKIDGNKASATIVGKRKEPIHFAKVKGGWLLDLATTMKEAFKVRPAPNLLRPQGAPDKIPGLPPKPKQ